MRIANFSLTNCFYLTHRKRACLLVIVLRGGGGGVQPKLMWKLGLEIGAYQKAPPIILYRMGLISKSREDCIYGFQQIWPVAERKYGLRVWQRKNLISA